jgi:exopolyphosphatase/guanosine-5'-triphosphate,3'-diphosphate pyrophosphatase
MPDLIWRSASRAWPTRRSCSEDGDLLPPVDCVRSLDTEHKVNEQQSRVDTARASQRRTTTGVLDARHPWPGLDPARAPSTPGPVTGSQRTRLHPADQPLAIVDLGSNSSRVVVLRVDPTGYLEILADGRSPLRLARDVGNGGRLSAEAIQRTVEALKDFRAVASGSGAGTTIAVATSAIRESTNADELMERIQVEGGLTVRVIDGAEEARYGFLGAVHGVQVEHGMVVDIGGGSMELSRFRDRTLVESWTLPLGALRLSDRFLVTDPPTDREVETLREHVRGAVADAGVPTLRSDEQLIGTGGTIRNLAKMDRHARRYPIPRLHGYMLTRRRIEDLSELVTSRRLARRKGIGGLNADRADSIVGGALGAGSTMDLLLADAVIVTSQGVREGLAYDAVGKVTPSAEEARRMSIAALARRFTSWDQRRAARRVGMASRILETLEPGAGPGVRERLSQAATILDIGRSIDYYRRYEHTADILTESDLAGFSHRKLALLAAVVRQAGDETMSVNLYRPLLGPDDRQPIARQATILAIADEIESRIAPGNGLPVDCETRRREVLLRAPLFDGYRQGLLAARFRRAFGKRLVLEPPA